MKRKDWISLTAGSIIAVITFLGLCVATTKYWLPAVIVFILMVFFFIMAVVARKRKGGHIGFWRGLSYVLFGLTVLCLLMGAVPFTHFFHVIGSKDEVAENVTNILEKCDKLFTTYEDGIGDRLRTYEEEVKDAYHGSKIKMEILIESDRSATNYNEFPKKWVEARLLNFKSNKEQFEKQKPKFENVLIHNFNPFILTREFNQLKEQYQKYYDFLSEEYGKKTPFEEAYEVEIVFKPKGIDKETEVVNNILSLNKSSIRFDWFIILYLVLAFFACSSYIFFKDETMGKFSKKGTYADVYEKGIQLNLNR